ncbi:hypothetical protein [Variovorax sp. Sphag1AA]|uniref:hypothetical protein n=1 Tax=Variovorax sp. Sphag1AA TaxID=2587027 RepID=UPI00160A6400|nr:hypothetical protein [Variovorax sp. Sphag1AA]MBB3177498.1 hypothetical protein [Variovorax sp. Sphag1AA]
MDWLQMQRSDDTKSQVIQRVELDCVELLEQENGFVLGFVDMQNGTYRMQLPSWALHQLMRALPRLDAALQARSRLNSALIAYPVTQWSAERTGVDDAVALCLQTDRGVESGFLLSRADASALHAALGEAIHAPEALRHR